METLHWREPNDEKQENKLFGCCPACVAYLEYAQPCVGVKNGVSSRIYNVKFLGNFSSSWPAQLGEIASFRVGFLEKVVLIFVAEAQLQRNGERCGARR